MTPHSATVQSDLPYPRLEIRAANDCRLIGVEFTRELQTFLRCEDKRAEFSYKRLRRQAARFAEVPPALADELEKVNRLRVRNLLWEDPEFGGLRTYAGLAVQLGKMLGIQVVDCSPAGPAPLARKRPLSADPRWFQRRVVELAEVNRLLTCEIATGLGKSMCIELLCERFGDGALIMTPYTHLAEALYDQLSEAFGRSNVGALFGGKRDVGKSVLVATNSSVVSAAKRGDRKGLADRGLMVGDEAHQDAADTLAKVFVGLLGAVRRRVFLTATFLRPDGLQRLLEGLCGEVALRVSLKDGVAQKFLARPIPWVVQVRPDPEKPPFCSDIGKLSRWHLLDNPAASRVVGAITRARLAKGGRVVVLVEEVSQFAGLLPHLDHDVGFAHGPLAEKARELVPQAYWKSDTKELVKRFNAGDLRLLVGTGCIGIGADLRPATDVVYWMGDTSPNKLLQALGRGTRLSEGKDSFNFYDVASTVPDLARQMNSRAATIESVWAAPRIIPPMDKHYDKK